MRKRNNYLKIFIILLLCIGLGSTEVFAENDKLSFPVISDGNYTGDPGTADTYYSGIGWHYDWTNSDRVSESSFDFLQAKAGSGTCGTNVKYSVSGSTINFSKTNSGSAAVFASDCVDVFRNDASIKVVNINDVIRVLDGDSLFLGCLYVTQMNLSKLDVSNVSSMRIMFRECNALTSLDIGSWDTSNVTNMDGLFSNNFALTNLDVSSWDTSNVTDMPGVFASCSSLTNLDVSGWDTSNVTYMQDMFYECRSLTSLDVSGWNTSKVTSMNNMFGDCNELTSLDVSSWNTSKVVDMSQMFGNCFKLTSLDVSGWNTSKVTKMGGLFSSCYVLANLDVSGWDTSNVTEMAGMFGACSTLTSLNLSGWDTSKVTTMRDMFDQCHRLANLNVRGWNTSNVTDMYHMFRDCRVLPSLDVSGWNTSKVVDMSQMFGNCFKLTSLDVSGWNTSKVTKMGGLFSSCYVLANLDVSGWDTSNVTEMAGMFGACSTLTSLNLSGWDTSKVTTMRDMFDQCHRLANLNVSGWNISNVTDIAGMFEACGTLASLDVSGWNTSNVTDMTNVFIGCDSLKTLVLGVNTLGKNIFGSLPGYNDTWYYTKQGSIAGNPLALGTSKEKGTLFTSYNYNTMAGTWTTNPPLTKLTISQGNVLGYSNGIEMKTTYDANATGYSISVYDVANQKTITPTVDSPVKSGSNVTIKIHGSSLVNGNIYRLTVYKYRTSGGTTTKSNTVTIYGMPHSVISKVTAQPIGSGVRLDSEFKAGTDGTRYYVYDAATGAQVKKLNLTGPASHLKITGLENNKLYYSYARPYKMYNNQYILGPKSKIVYYAPVAMPSGVSVAFSNETTAVISTAQNATARGVRVLYREVGGSLKNGCVQAGTQCTIGNLSQAKSYEFYVMHYNIINNVRHYGSGITIQYNAPTVSTLPRPTGIKIYAGNPTWTFSITKDSSAQGISVLYRINEGNYALACEKAGASCTKDLTKDKAYTFFIMQYKLVNGKKVYSPGATVKNLYGTKTVDGDVLDTAFVEVEEAFDTEELYGVLEDYLTEEDLNALEAMEITEMEDPGSYPGEIDAELNEEADLYDFIEGGFTGTYEADAYEPYEADYIEVNTDEYAAGDQAEVYGKAAMTTLSISQGNVLGYSNGIEVKTAYDANAKSYSISVYDVANKKTVKPTIDAPVKSGSSVTIKIHGSSLVNGRIYQLTVYKTDAAGEKSNTVTVYGMPHSLISSVTAQPIGTGVRLDSVFKTGTDGTRYYVYDAATNAQVKKQNLTGPASHLKITGLENNKLYYAYARPYKIYNNQYILGPKSKVVYFVPVAMPSGVTVQYSDLTTAVITTAENATASGVWVLYREVGGSLKNGCVQAGNQCSIGNLSQTKSYEFYVMHYNIINNVRHYGSGITIQTNAPTVSTLARPTGIKIYAGNPTWTFSITKDASAQGISVLYRVGEGNFALACEKDGASCTMDLTKDQAYTFFIMQYKVVDGKKVYSAGATVKNLYGTKTIDGNDLVTEFVEAEESINPDDLYEILEDYLTENDVNGFEAMDVIAMEGEDVYPEELDAELFEEEDLYDDPVPEEFRTMEDADDYEPAESDYIDVPMEGTSADVLDGYESAEGQPIDGYQEITAPKNLESESDDIPGLIFYGIDDSSYSYEKPAPSFNSK